MTDARDLVRLRMRRDGALARCWGSKQGGGTIVRAELSLNGGRGATVEGRTARPSA